MKWNNLFFFITNASRKTKANLNREISDLELSVHDTENRLEQATCSAMEKAKELQEIQKNNLDLNAELRSCFTETVRSCFFSEIPEITSFFVCLANATTLHP